MSLLGKGGEWLANVAEWCSGMHLWSVALGLMFTAHRAKRENCGVEWARAAFYVFIAHFFVPISSRSRHRRHFDSLIRVYGSAGRRGREGGKSVNP